MIFPKNYYRSHSYIVLFLTHFFPMTAKYLKVLVKQIFTIAKKKNISKDLTFPKFSSDRNDLCESCLFCEKICPTQAIKLIFKGKKIQHFALNMAQCTRCQICIQVCPESLLAEKSISLVCLELEEEKMWMESTPSGH